jgi:glucose/mannose transport system substrate-binding protein
MKTERLLHLLIAILGGILLSATLIFSLSALSLNGQAKKSENTELEIYSYWISGGEADGLSALIDVYTSTYSNTIVTVNSDYDELSNRITSGKPPDDFQYHCGSELFYNWIEPGDYITPVTQLWADQAWMNKVPQDFLDMITFKGELYCVPLNIHRGNVLWYNKHVFTDNGLTPPTTFTEFFTVAQALETAGKIPLALGDQGTWSDVHLMETVLLGSMGPDKYRGLWNGTTSFNGPEVKDALETFDNMMDYVNTNHSTLQWGGAVQLVGNGQAGMTIMGDWAEGYLEDMGLIPNVDFGWIPVPGSAGSFMIVNDSFVMPRNVPHPGEATNWLKIVGSVEGQDVFNPFKGSIPARLDANPTLYGIYQQLAMTDYATDELTPSLIHGVAAPPSFIGATNSILQDFIANGNIETTSNAWQKAACEAGFGKCLISLPLVLKNAP